MKHLKVIIYLSVQDIAKTIAFYCDVTGLFHLDKSNSELPKNGRLVLISNPSIELSVSENNYQQNNNSDKYFLSIEANDIKYIFNKIKFLSEKLINYGVYTDFFGEYLTTPISEQFAIKDPDGNKILIFENLESKHSMQ